jgi:hypothetical protein
MTMPGVHPDLTAIAETAWIAAPDRYVLAGHERRIGTAADAEAAGAAAPPQAILRQMVENELYYRLYRRPSEPLATDPSVAEVDTMRTYTAALSVANCGTGTWDPGWLIEGMAADGRVLLRREEVAYRAERADVRSAEHESGTAPLSAGMRARVRVPKELRQLSQGFYMALGDCAWPDPPDGQDRLVRFYWSLSSAVAPDYLGRITRALNGLRVPFRTKVAQDPSQYRNADAGVLYVPSRVLGEVWPKIEETYAAVRTGLRPVVPMFTRCLAVGLGMAEDPGGGISFGQSRCRLAASGLWSAFETGAHDAEGRLHHIAAAFRANDIDPARPHRSRNAPFADLPFEPMRPLASRAMATEPRGP